MKLLASFIKLRSSKLQCEALSHLQEITLRYILLFVSPTDSQCTRNVKFETPRITNFVVEMIIIMYCDCVFVSLRIEYVRRMRRIMLSVACPGLSYCRYYLTNGTVFETQVLNVQRVF
jgi:hypothetical protein